MMLTGCSPMVRVRAKVSHSIKNAPPKKADKGSKYR